MGLLLQTQRNRPAENEHAYLLRALCLNITPFTDWCRQGLNGEVWLFRFVFSLLTILHNVSVKLVTILCRYVSEMLPAFTKRLISPSSLHEFSWEKQLTYLLFFQVDFVLPYIEVSWDINKGYLYAIQQTHISLISCLWTSDTLGVAEPWLSFSKENDTR